MRLIPRTTDQPESPIGAAVRQLREYSGNRPLIDASQGAPNYPTAPSIARRIAEVAVDPEGGRYTARAGIHELRQLVANEMSDAYRGCVSAAEVLITTGCNQAFCLATSALCDVGDQVVLPVPYYFNHHMWLKLDRVEPVLLDTAPSFVADPHAIDDAITDRTRAVVLVTPGNPSGATTAPEVIHAIAEVARRRGVMLILDETYRVFRGSVLPPHCLFGQEGWQETVISLHSFSKEFAIPGHRVGAVVGHADLIVEMMKLSDCLTICAPRLGQVAVMQGLLAEKAWRSEKAKEVQDRLARFECALSASPGGFELVSAGAFFGWVRHPDRVRTADEVARRLLVDFGIFVLPGTLFGPNEGRYLRFSFGSLSGEQIEDIGLRLTEWT